MTVTMPTFTFHFPAEFDDRAEYEMALKGHLGYCEVELPGGNRYPIFFFDPVRLSQESERSAGDDRPVVAEHGMVVIPEVTRDNILRAVERLVRERFFDHLRPLTPAAVNGAAR
jgi:hypothetical protein